MTTEYSSSPISNELSFRMSLLGLLFPKAEDEIQELSNLRSGLDATAPQPRLS